MASGLARFISLLFALGWGEGVSARRRRRGFEGWGRHLCDGPATAATDGLALTHPPNLRAPRTLTVRSSHSRGNRGDRSRRLRGAGPVHAAIPEERIEDARQPAGKRDDGDLRAAAAGGRRRSMETAA